MIDVKMLETLSVIGLAGIAAFPLNPHDPQTPHVAFTILGFAMFFEFCIWRIH